MVRLPEGVWIGMDGAAGEGRIRGPDTIRVDAEGEPGEHDKLIWFLRKSESEEAERHGAEKLVYSEEVEFEDINRD